MPPCNLQPVGNLEPCEPDGEYGNHDGHRAVGEPLVAAVEQQIEDEEHDARHQQRPEEPEGARQELVVAAHREDDVYQPLPELEPVVGVGDTVRPVAVLLVQQPDLEKQVVEDQEEDAPLDKGHIQPLDPLHAESPRVTQVFLVKEIARRDEEQRHVEQVDEVHEQFGPLGVARTHQDDGYRLADRQVGIVAFHYKFVGIIIMRISQSYLLSLNVLSIRGVS